MKRHFAFLFTGFFFLFCGTLAAQTVSLDWSAAEGNTGFDVGRAITEDAQGNLLSTGYFQGSVDFDPGPGQVTLTSNGDTDIFIKKMDAAGNLIWAKSIGGIATDDGKSIALDGNGNIYIAGRFGATVDFDPGAGTSNETAVGQIDAYILKLDAAGDFLWAKPLGGVGMDESYFLSVNNQSVTCTGIFQGTVDFDPGAGTSNLSSDAGSLDIFVLQLDAAGNFQWAKSIGGSDIDVGLGIGQDGIGNLYLTGIFRGVVDFDPGAGIMNMTSNASGASYLLKLDGSGNFLWANQIGDANASGIGYAVSVASNGDVYTTGGFNGIVDLDPGVGIQADTSTFGSFDIYLQKLNSSGSLIWANSIGGFGDDYGYALDDNASGIYFTGVYGATVDFDPGAGVFSMTSFNNTFDAFVEKLDVNGQFQWVKPIGGSGVDYGFGIHASSTNQVNTIGCYEATVDFDPDSTIDEFTSAGSADIFIQRLKECSASSGSANLTGCDSLVVNGQTFHTNGTYVQNLQNVFGCDSTLTLTISIIQVDTSVTQTGTDLIANAAFASYQWLDCDNGFASIPGETIQIFSPTVNGNYAVAVTVVGCTDTSACRNVIVVGLDEDLSSEIQLYPNPNTGSFMIELPEDLDQLQFEIRDALGKLVLQQKANSGLNQISFEGPAGIYFIRGEGQNTRFQRVFIKK